jgi:hypothetical protein
MQFNLFYPQLTSLRKEIFEIEDSLKEYFNPFTISPFPDDAPAEIPRCQAVSKGGYTNISISLVSTQIITNFDLNFNKDWNKCYQYFKKTTENINNAINSKIAKHILFYGLSTQIVFDEYSDNVVSLIQSKFLKQYTAKPFEINLRLAFEINNDYYVNFTFSHEYSYDMLATEILDDPKKLNKSLLLTLDVNNKKGFNFTTGYKSSKDDFDFIFEETNSIISEKIHEIIKNGDIKL